MAIETLYATSHITGAFSNPANAVGSTTATWAGDLNVNSNYTSRWAIGDPVNNLTPGATQTFVVRARKGSNSGNPTIQINLYVNGSLIASGSTQNVTSTTGQDITQSFNTSQITDKNQVEIEVVQTSSGGSPSTRNSAQVDYIRWSADSTAGRDVTGGSGGVINVIGAGAGTKSFTGGSGGVVDVIGNGAGTKSFTGGAGGAVNVSGAGAGVANRQSYKHIFSTVGYYQVNELVSASTKRKNGAVQLYNRKVRQGGVLV